MPRRNNNSNVNAAPFTVFLDRDGVFNRHPAIGVRSWKKFHWLPGVREAFARLNRPDVQTCLCTNQPAVGFLLNSRRAVEAIHHRMMEELAATGGRLDHVEAAYAPLYVRHRRTKPRPGMLEDGAVALGNVDKRRAVMVGDKTKDAAAAAAFGIPAILLATTDDAHTLEAKARNRGIPYAAIVPDLEAAVDLILSWIDG